MRREKVALHSKTVEGALRDLKGTLGRDTDRARIILERLIGKVTLRREGRRVIAEIGGNLPGLLNLETRWVDSFGAGSQASRLSRSRKLLSGLIPPFEATPPVWELWVA